MKSQIMYIECKGDSLSGPARIGLVTFSKTGRTLRYQGKELQPISSYKANYLDMDTGKRYWISGCKKNGDDTLYPGIIEIAHQGDHIGSPLHNWRNGWQPQA